MLVRDIVTTDKELSPDPKVQYRQRCCISVCFSDAVYITRVPLTIHLILTLTIPTVGYSICLKSSL